ncbi:MAG: family 43 glycosylhydrolase [bacterium]
MRFPVGPFVDYPNNPILSPQAGLKRIYNPTVIRDNGIFYMLLRGEGNDGLTGKIYLAKGNSPTSFKLFPKPCLSPSAEFDIGGCEDPRVVKFNDTYYLTYVGNSKRYNVSNICLATSKDLINWEKHGPILQTGKWDSGQLKAGAILNEKINGKYVMYFMGEESPWVTAIGIAYSEDLFFWYEPIDEPILSPRDGYFDSQGVEPGPNPVVIEEGILLIYNGWGKDCIYRPGGVIFSKEDPAKILERMDKPILVPNAIEGLNKDYHVVSEGLISFNDRWFLYYGAGDKFSSLATYP